MVASVQSLIEQAQSLEPEQRAELVARLMESMIPANPEVDEKWRPIFRERLRALRAGEIESESIEDFWARFQRDHS